MLHLNLKTNEDLNDIGNLSLNLNRIFTLKFVVNTKSRFIWGKLVLISFMSFFSYYK